MPHEMKIFPGIFLVSSIYVKFSASMYDAFLSAQARQGKATCDGYDSDWNFKVIVLN